MATESHNPKPANSTARPSGIVPDLWQQQAVTALREGRDVVIHAPTGAGKTLIFELWSDHGKSRSQAIYTVPTRALANDKLAEWRARGWEVGIATGDLSENLNAPVIIATLETQKSRLIKGDGPALLIVDEYQMLGDPDRGLNYELALALAPPQTQLLLLSGSVGNPHDVVKWLQRLGRRATLIRHEERPVPLEEVWADNLNFHVPTEIRGYWPRLVAKALAENLGPVLLFAPRRANTESLAAELARQLPPPTPLILSSDQKKIVGEHLARMLRNRVTYHHSGLSYAARAGVIEPLAKAGQLRAVVATMGLAAGINFSLRSVALAGDSYRRDGREFPLRADEVLQMFGRAGRRGLDKTGYVLVSANELRLRDGFPCHLSRSGMVDWGALLGIMSAAAEAGREPFAEAARVQQRLFTTKPIPLGVEEAIKNPDAPCNLKTDAERARHVRQRVRELLNSRGEWQPIPAAIEKPLRDIWKIASPNPSETSHTGSEIALAPVSSEPSALEKISTGSLAVLREDAAGKIYGRSVTVAEKLNDGSLVLAKWVRRLTNWTGRNAPLAAWQEKIVPLIEQKMAAQRLSIDRFVDHPNKITALVSLAEQTLRVPVDAHGIALWNPPTREVTPSDCARCTLVPVCQKLSTTAGVALLWRRLGLVDAAGVPTTRGRIVSFFHGGDGLAIAAALEEKRYPLDELIYDLANLNGGFRFCGAEDRWGGRLARASQQCFGSENIPGYLENGLPPQYGSGAESVVAAAHKNPAAKHAWVTEILGAGDIDRAIIEWRSHLRQISHAPVLDWPRWTGLQALAKRILKETESPTLTELPPLEHSQTRRMEHRLVLRRH
ncbi:MAG: DEAD/DEAH box helicase [Pedosphaera sp.]|nr:DEAD/DEAH box helicase [Pedosphaera sp.]